MKYSYSLSEKTPVLLILLTCLLFIGNVVIQKLEFEPINAVAYFEIDVVGIAI